MEDIFNSTSCRGKLLRKFLGYYPQKWRYLTQMRKASFQSGGISDGAGADENAVRQTQLQWSELTWTKLISKHIKSGEGRKALKMYKEMREEGVIPNTYTFVAALQACSSITDLQAGKEIHAHVIEKGDESNVIVATTLMDMYAKCGSMVDVSKVFEKMPYRNVVSWTAVIMSYAQGAGELALYLYERMQHEGFTPNARTFVAALKACSSVAAQEGGKQVDGELVKIRWLEKGRAIHSQLAKSGFESNIFVASTLVDMYAKCGSMVDACQVFEKMQYRNVVSWTSMIMGYAQKEGRLALQLYARMQHEGCRPNARTFIAALKACGSLAEQEEGKQVDGKLLKLRCLEEGKGIHSQVARSGFESDVFVASTLVVMYVKCGSMVDAREVFENMPYRDVASWNAIIMGYAQMETGELALQLYARMQDEGFTPDSRTYVAALKACGSLALREKGKQVDGEPVKCAYLEKGRAIHSQVAKSAYVADIFVSNAILDMYIKCGSVVDACLVFEKMLHRDLVSWTTMIMGYAQMEKGELALQLYAHMQREGIRPDAHTFVATLKACGSLAVQEGTLVDRELMKRWCLKKGRAIHSEVAKQGLESDIFIANSLVGMYAKCGSMLHARCIFEKMIDRDLVSWNAMIMGYAQREEGELALQLYARMKHEGFTPDGFTFVAALMACGNLASLETGKEIHNEICTVGLEREMFVANCLVDMYGKCGSMIDAELLFNALPKRDVVTWSALIAGFSGQGDSEFVFDLFEKMQQEGIRPVGVTFVSVLTACSHTGLVDRGLKYFHAMYSIYGIIPAGEHYSCMVDLLGRAGRLDEAVAMVKNMPLKPNIVTWMTILGACRKWNNVDAGRHAFDCAMVSDGEKAPAYTLMTNIYGSAHMWQDY